MTDLRQYSKPARKRIDRVLLAASTEGQTLVQLVGSWNCADVWLRAPVDASSPWPQATLTLWGRDGASLVPLQSMQPRDVPGNTKGQRPTVRAQLVLSVRGRQCDTFLVTAIPGSGEAITDTEGEIVLECWGSDQPVCPAYYDLAAIAMGLPETNVSTAGVPGWCFNRGPSVLWRATGVNTSGAPAYLQIYDTDTIPTPGAIPLDPGILTADGGSATITPPRGMRLRSGATLGWSTTPDIFTAGAGLLTADWQSIG